jgi:hypothetical protein
VRVSVNAPVPAEGVVTTLRVENAVGVTGLGTEHVTPDGQPATVRPTLPLNPFNAVTVIVEVPDPPRVSVIDAGVSRTEKSPVGGATGLTVSATVVE